MAKITARVFATTFLSLGRGVSISAGRVVVSGASRRKILISAKSQISRDGAWFGLEAPDARPTLWLSDLEAKRVLKRALFWVFFRLPAKKRAKTV
mgnify:CR=1 FL=1